MQYDLFETHVSLVFILEATSNQIAPTQLLGRILWDHISYERNSPLISKSSFTNNTHIVY